MTWGNGFGEVRVAFVPSRVILGFVTVDWTEAHDALRHVDPTIN